MINLEIYSLSLPRLGLPPCRRWGGLCAPVIPRAIYVGWSLVLLAGTPMPNRSKGRGQTKSDPTGPQGWGLGRGLISLFRKKKRIITETRSRVNSLFQRGTVAAPYRRELKKRTVEKERQEAGWRSWEEVRTAATHREEWKSSVKAL